jgi:hypothetical protein
MSEQWRVDGPRVVEVGGPDTPVRELKVGLVAGRVDVVAHDEPSAQVEITSVTGRELEISWHDGVLSVSHPQVRWDGLLDALKGLGRREDEAQISIALPRTASVRVSTVSADGLLSGLTARANVRTVSGELVLDDVSGDVTARTISGRIDVRALRGSLTGESVSGSLTVQALAMPELNVKTVSGELVVDLAQAPSSVTMRSVSGDLVVRIPADAGYRLDARSVSGQIVADGRRLGAGRPGPPQGEIRTGDESVRVSATSVSGDVTMLRTDPA